MITLPSVIILGISPMQELNWQLQQYTILKELGEMMEHIAIWHPPPLLLSGALLIDLHVSCTGSQPVWLSSLKWEVDQQKDVDNTYPQNAATEQFH